MNEDEASVIDETTGNCLLKEAVFWFVCVCVCVSVYVCVYARVCLSVCVHSISYLFVSG